MAHTSRPTWGYLLRVPAASMAWAPEFWAFPAWAAGVDLMFADAAGWNRVIRFAGGAGGHLSALRVAGQARQHQVGRLVFAPHRPPLAAGDRRRVPAAVWGMGQPGQTYRLPPRSR